MEAGGRRHRRRAERKAKAAYALLREPSERGGARRLWPLKIGRPSVRELLLLALSHSALAQLFVVVVAVAGAVNVIIVVITISLEGILSQKKQLANVLRYQPHLRPIPTESPPYTSSYF